MKHPAAMPYPRAARHWHLAAAALLSLVLYAGWGSSQAQELTPQELRGKRIYEQGIGGGKQPISATVSGAPEAVPGTMVPCGVCHGADGRGVADDGVAPPDIRWSALADPAGHRHGSGRQHPPFDTQALGRAISDGVDPAGNVMEASMPRYAMLLTDLEDLLAYMKRLEQELDPGLGKDSIRLATIQPAEGELAGAGAAMEAVMHAYFDEVNVAGGVEGRLIELVSADYVADPTLGGWMVQDLLREQRPFALVGTYVAGIEAATAAVADALNVPVVGALSPMPEAAGASNRYMFYLLSGLRGQASALARHAGTLMPGPQPRMVVVHPAGAQFAGPVKAIQQQGLDSGWATVPVLPYQAGELDAAFLAGELHDKGAQGVFFLGPEEDLGALVRQADRLDWSPRIFLPGMLATDAMFDYPERFDRRIHVAVSLLPSDMDPGGAEHFKRVHDQQQLDYQYLENQVQAYAAARLVVEALRRTGADLSREGLIATLESMHDYQSGVVPPLSFTAGQRVGAAGAHLMVLDLKKKAFSEGGGWVSVATDDSRP